MAATRSNITETQMNFLYIIFDRSAGCVSNFRAMVPNLDEWQQVEKHACVRKLHVRSDTFYQIRSHFSTHFAAFTMHQ